MKQVSNGQIKITPDVLVQGGQNSATGESNSSNVLAAFLAS